MISIIAFQKVLSEYRPDSATGNLIRRLRSGTRWFNTSVAPRAEALSLKRVFDDDKYWEAMNRHNYDTMTSRLFGDGPSPPPPSSSSSSATSSTVTSSNGMKIFTPLRNTLLKGGMERENVGLFKNPYLKSPKGLIKFSNDSLKRATELAEKLRTDTSEEGRQNFIIKLDQLSDTLCRVIDLCEFIRSSHPNTKFVKAAQQCHEQMFEFMNILNTDVTLYNTLKDVLNDSKVVSKLSEEEIKVGRLLLEDFEKAGINMDPDIREQFILLSQEISLVGQDFISNTSWAAENNVLIPVKSLQDSGVSPSVLNSLQRDVTRTKYKVPTYGTLPFAILRTCRDEEVREKVWTALHSCPDDQISRLTHLIKLRAILADLMGKSSFSEYTLDGKMAKNPEDVRNFIDTLLVNTRPTAAQELKFISDLKCEDACIPAVSEVDEILSVVRPWDRDYYTALSRSLSKEDKAKQEALQPMSAYFTLGSVFRGLSSLFENIYGITLEPVVPERGETWSPEVRRLNVCSKDEGLIGVIYCDLFERSGKTANPAHFTVCCSRHMYEHENDESIMQIGVDATGTRYQLPIISLVCNFSKLPTPTGHDVCLLQFTDLETLFHEMGHAMHSMLGRTRLQNISGTRCPTDYVELPSIIMEHFARDKRVLKSIGRHYLTNEIIPDKLIDKTIENSKFLKDCETFAQAKMSMLDQVLHGSEIKKNIGNLDVVEIYQTLESKLQVLADDKSNWCGKFGHLFGYGATYYSYLLDRAIASKVFQVLFEKDPFSPVGGSKFKNGVLKWGGLRDPWVALADVLNQPELAKGDSNAMKFIGSAHNI